MAYGSDEAVNVGADFGVHDLFLPTVIHYGERADWNTTSAGVLRVSVLTVALYCTSRVRRVAPMTCYIIQSMTHITCIPTEVHSDNLISTTEPKSSFTIRIPLNLLDLRHKEQC